MGGLGEGGGLRTIGVGHGVSGGGWGGEGGRASVQGWVEQVAAGGLAGSGSQG